MFKHWIIEDGTVTSAEAEHSFTFNANKDVTFFAVFEANKASLTNLMEEAWIFALANQGNIDPSAVNDLQQTFGDAEAVVNNQSATAEQVAEVRQALAQAFSELKESYPADAVDKSQLFRTFFDAQDLLTHNGNEMSESTRNALKNAGDAIIAVLEDGSATQEQIDNAETVLRSAIIAAQKEIGLSPVFADVPESAWFHSIVYTAVSEGLITGYQTTPPTFKPNSKITRGQVATTLFRASGETAGAANTFSDVPSGQYYTDGVARCASQGIVTGYGSGAGAKFKPNANVSRQELAVIIARYAAWKNGQDVSSISGSNAWTSLKGASSVASWARGPIAWAVDHDIIGSNGNLNPKGNATRAEATKMILLGVHV